MPNPQYVANPTKGSRHNRGCAIDITLVDKYDKELDMGTDFDCFTEKAHKSYTNLPEDVLKNRKLLHNIMEKHHFIGWKNEWWHFDFENWQDYPILDIAFDEVE